MKYTAYIIAVLTMLSPLFGNAQDGEKLFKSKCNTCHLVDKNSTGPSLKGVKAKWEEAGELELLYKWVENSGELILSGESQMAAAIKDFSPTTMAPQAATPEEIDAILDYVDNYTPPVETEQGPEGEKGEGPVTYVPNYDQNLTLFYALLITMLALLIAIIIMSGSVIRLIHSDFFKDKVKESGKNPLIKAIVLLIGFTTFVGNSSYALQFNGPGEATEGMPWLQVENSDVYVMVIINIILIGVLFYIRRMFKIFLNMTKTQEEIKAQEEEADVVSKVNQILTDVVPIEEEHTILMHHEYDGIRELDNNLPPWWVWGFYFTIGFAVVYIFNYHILGTGDLQTAEYNKDVKQAEIAKAAYLKKMAMDVDETNVTLMEGDSDLATGKTLFLENCAVCHKDGGEGDTGPNLTDKNWIYGYDIADVFTSIKYGRANGMPEHKSKMNPVQLQQVSSYVLSLPEKSGKPAEGDIVEE